MPQFFSSYWSPPRGTIEEIVGFIDRCETSLYVCVYSLTHDDASDAIIRAHNRGLDVKVITDNLQSKNRYADDEKLEAAGVPIRRDPRSSAMHRKMVIGDMVAMGIGSFNWTQNAEERNREQFHIVRFKYACVDAKKEFDRLWERIGKLMLR